MFTGMLAAELLVKKAVIPLSFRQRRTSGYGFWRVQMKVMIGLITSATKSMVPTSQKLESLADAFKDQIQVNFGIELGLQPQLAESFSDLLKEVPFDFVIGSSHVVHGYDPYYPSYFEGRKESARIRTRAASVIWRGC